MKNLALILISMLLASPCQAFDREEQSIISLYEKINPAIVCVDSQVSDGLSCGTGCIIDKRGVILTSAHVIDVGKSIVVTMSNGQNYNAKVLKRFGENKDIALLKIDVPTELKTVKLGDSERIKVGQKVLAIGNPFGFNGTLTQGIISSSSGGPLLNKNGEIIGINQAIYNPDNNISNIGIGFAIPINSVKEYLKESNTI